MSLPDRILIERREVIGEVSIGPAGRHKHPVIAAFAIVAEYMNDHAARGDAPTVEFEYEGVTFTTSVELPEGMGDDAAVSAI